MTEYLNEFVQESQESITELNNALLDLEQSADDETMDRVFRTAHTLKGNCGAMGFDDASDLAHAIEDLLDEIRGGRLEATPDLMDEIFDAVDTLEGMIDEVEAHGDTRSDPADRIRALRERLEAASDFAAPSDEEVVSGLRRADRPGRYPSVYHVRIALPDDPESGERALAALDDAFDLLSTDPGRSAVGEGDHDGVVDVVFGGGVEETSVRGALDRIDPVDEAIVTPATDELLSRAEPEESAGAGADVGDADDLSVDDLLDEFEEYDDLDAAVDRVEDVSGLENMGEAGAFDDIVEDEVEPAYEEVQADPDSGAEADETEADEEEGVEDAMGEFQELQEEYDQVGLDEMEAELDGVEFGEYDQDDEVGFDDLLDDDFLEEDTDPEPAETGAEPAASDDGDESTPEIEAPSGEDVEATLDDADPPADPDQIVYHARIAVGRDDAETAVEALRDAFDLLGGRDLDADDRIDVVFGSHVGEDEIRSALDSVEEVAGAEITDVTDRAPEPPEPEPEGKADADEGDAADDGEPDPEVIEAEGEIEDAQSEFEQMQAAYDEVGLDEIEQELEDTEFGEYDQDDEVGFDDLLDDDFLDEEVEDGGPAGETDAEEEAETGEPDVEAGEPEAKAETGEEPAESTTETEPATPAIEPPSGEDVEATLDDADPPGEAGEQVYHVRIAAASDDTEVAVEALRDAFDLLGTRPLDADDRIDAVFGSHVGEDEIRSALDSVEEVAGAEITDVTDRAPEPPEPDPGEEADTGEVEAETEDVEPDPEVIEAEGEIEDAQSEFEQMQAAYDEVGLDEIEQELEDTEFGEYDQDDEIGFDDLLDDDFLDDEVEAGEPAVEAEPADETDTEAVEAGEPGVETGEPEVEADSGVEDESGVEAEADDDAVAANVETETGSAETGPTPEPADADPTPESTDADPTPESTDADPTPKSVDAGEPDPADAGPAAGIESLTDEEVEAALDVADPPSESDQPVYLTRLAIVEESGVNNARRVVEAIRDAFDLLGTRPPEREIDAGDHEGYVDAVFGSHVGSDEIRTALDPVEEVAETLVENVTDRTPDVEPASAHPSEAEIVEAEGEIEDAQFEFQQMQEAYDEVEPDEIEQELEDVEFGEYDQEEEVSFDDLFVDVPIEEEAEPADVGTDEGAETVGAEVETDPSETSADAADDDQFETPEEGLGGTTGSEDIDEVEVGEFSVGDDTAETEFGVDLDDDELADVEIGEVDEPTIDPEEAVGPGVDEADEPEDEAAQPVDTIRGIGASYSDRLSRIGIETVGDLVAADPGSVAADIDVSRTRVEEWIDRCPVEPPSESTDEAEAEPDPAAVETKPSFSDPEPAEPVVDPDLVEKAKAAMREEGGTTSTDGEADEIQSVRVDVDRIDDLLNLVEGLVTTRARLRRAVQEGADPESLDDEIDELEVITAEMQDNVMEMRLVPFQTVTQRLPRVVRDVAREQGKQVHFDVEGEDVEIDRSILNRIGDPLIHMVRNAVDHGIESPEEREIGGKPGEGEVTLRAYRSREDVHIEVEDDGAGLDPDELRSKAVEDGVLSREAADALDDGDAYELVFESGLSTNEEVTDVSGRGVGMDVVASVVEDLEGGVEVESTPGEGTTVRMILPVSVAISEVVFVESGDEEYGIPIKVVDEIGSMATAERVATDGGGEVIRTAEGNEKDLIEIHEELEVDGATATDREGMLVTIEDEVRSAAIHCDGVHGQQEVVVKPFEGLLADIPGLSGAAVLGEGDVVNVLDVESL